MVPDAIVSDTADFERDSAAVGKGAGIAVDGARSFSKRETISRMFLRLTCEKRQYLRRFHMTLLTMLHVNSSALIRILISSSSRLARISS
jgi:hypothetical protein